MGVQCRFGFPAGSSIDRFCLAMIEDPPLGTWLKKHHADYAGGGAISSSWLPLRVMTRSADTDLVGVSGRKLTHHGFTHSVKKN